jgi:hypothetical protein
MRQIQVAIDVPSTHAPNREEKKIREEKRRRRREGKRENSSR